MTAVSTSDVVDGWRDRRRDGGVVLEVREQQGRGVAAVDAAFAARPRGRLWLLNSGTGYFGRIDRTTGRFEPLTFCPGYLRGLAFVGDYAMVGTSLPRHERTFAGLPLEDELKRRNAEARCGLFGHRPEDG